MLSISYSAASRPIRGPRLAVCGGLAVFVITKRRDCPISVICVKNCTCRARSGLAWFGNCCWKEFGNVFISRRLFRSIQAHATLSSSSSHTPFPGTTTSFISGFVPPTKTSYTLFFLTHNGRVIDVCSDPVGFDNIHLLLLTLIAS